jgi:enoyl-CoA hydratase
MADPVYRHLTYESFDDGAIVRIMLDRPEYKNAQHRALLVELDDAFLRAEEDDTVRVVILSGHGTMFSSGHDIGTAEAREDQFGDNPHPSRRIHGATRDTAVERMLLQEWHYFFENTLRWRNLRKITIAQVHGAVYAAGLMLMWACDLIVAAEHTTFADIVGTRLGMCGVEYFAHPWEFGPRKTKELMLTGDSIDAEEAYRLGMVSKVFPEVELGDRTLDFARRIAEVPTIAALLVKEAVNQTQDNMGFYNSLQACFTLHQLNHAHWGAVHGGPRFSARPGIDVPDWRERGPVKPAQKDTVIAP